MAPDKGYGPPIWKIAYISDVNRAKKVKSDDEAATNKNSDPVQKVSLGVAGENGAPTPFFSRPLQCNVRLLS